MKKKIAALCFAAALLAACGTDATANTAEVSETEASVETQSESISETTTVSETESETVSETTTETETVSETTTVSETESETVPETEAEPEPADYRAIYKEKLMSCIGEDAYFDLFDVNSDGVPELFISQTQVHLSGTRIHTIISDELVQLTGKSQDDDSDKYEFGANAVIGVSDTGIFDNCFGWGGITYYEYLKMENDKLVCVFSGEFECGPLGKPEGYRAYFIDGAEVTAEEFNEAVSPYESLSYRTVGTRYTLDEANINAVLDADYEPPAETTSASEFVLTPNT